MYMLAYVLAKLKVFARAGVAVGMKHDPVRTATGLRGDDPRAVFQDNAGPGRDFQAFEFSHVHVGTYRR